MNERPLPDPAVPGALDTPEAVLASTALTRDQKIARLRQMSYDARELEVASDEGMAGRGQPSSLARILAALNALGVDDVGTDSKQ